MRQFLRSKSNADTAVAACHRPAGSPALLSGIPLFETLVGETHLAVLHTAVVGSGINSLGRGGGLQTPLGLRSLMPRSPSLMDAAPRCWIELRLSIESLSSLREYVATFDHARDCIESFCHDVEQWGPQPAVFLHAVLLTAKWRRVARCAMRAVETLHPDVVRCFPARYGQNTAVLRRLLWGVLRGDAPCLNASGQLFLPELPQRRPAARRNVNLPCIVEHQGKIFRATVKDISAGGLGLDMFS
jgi:hypothetical protein